MFLINKKNSLFTYFCYGTACGLQIIKFPWDPNLKCYHTAFMRLPIKVSLCAFIHFIFSTAFCFLRPVASCSFSLKWLPAILAITWLITRSKIGIYLFTCINGTVDMELNFFWIRPPSNMDPKSPEHPNGWNGRSRLDKRYSKNSPITHQTSNGAALYHFICWHLTICTCKKLLHRIKKHANNESLLV